MKKRFFKDTYEKDELTALQAQRLALEITNGPIVFQVSRLMLKYNIFQLLNEKKEGMTQSEIVAKTKLSNYAVQVLLESSLTIGTIFKKNEKYFLAKTGWFLLHDEMAKVNMDFNHDVNYLGLFHLDESLETGKPAGLKVFGKWKTIYEGLSKLPADVQKSWFAFDHFYSDQSFDEALSLVFKYQPKKILDIGGNTGKWVEKCVTFSNEVNVTVMDLPQQLQLLQQTIAGKKGAERISTLAANVLDENITFPTGFDIIWMSQFLDCFSEKEIVHILSKIEASMQKECRIFVMETFWDRQRFETAAYCLTQISLYFTAMANGNSKMYHSKDMLQCIETAGLEVENIVDDLGLGHSIVICRKK